MISLRSVCWNIKNLEYLIWGHLIHFKIFFSRVSKVWNRKKILWYPILMLFLQNSEIRHINTLNIWFPKLAYLSAIMFSVSVCAAALPAPVSFSCHVVLCCPAVTSPLLTLQTVTVGTLASQQEPYKMMCNRWHHVWASSSNTTGKYTKRFDDLSRLFSGRPEGKSAKL